MNQYCMAKNIVLDILAIVVFNNILLNIISWLLYAVSYHWTASFFDFVSGLTNSLTKFVVNIFLANLLDFCTSSADSHVRWISLSMSSRDVGRSVPSSFLRHSFNGGEQSWSWIHLTKLLEDIVLFARCVRAQFQVITSTQTLAFSAFSILA